MLEIKPSGKKRCCGVILPPIPKEKNECAIKPSTTNTPTSLKEVLRKHTEILKKSISNRQDT